MTTLRETIDRYDTIISYRASDLKAHRWVTLIMVASSRLGDGPFFFLLGALLLTFGGADGMKAVVVMALACGLCTGVFKTVKHATSRKRPFETYPDLLNGVALPPPDEFSFPSGHSMNAFAVAACMGFYFPPLMIPLFTLAVMVAASRVFLALHYMTDVIAGAATGLAIAAALMVLFG